MINIFKHINNSVLFAVVLLLCNIPVISQIVIAVEIDSTQILIGEQSNIKLKVTSPVGSKVIFPNYLSKQLIPGIEVLDEKIISEEKINEDKTQVIIKQYTITSFDSTMYYIPPFKVLVNSKEYKSKSLALKVETIPIDTIHTDKYFGPKGIADVPYEWNDFKSLFYMSLLVLLLFITAIYLNVQLYTNRPIIRKFRIRPELPPHKWAISKIKKINSKVEVEQNSKDYYTQLTDVIRSYIHKRYGFNAMEMTSNEIINKLTSEPDSTMLDELSELFTTADMVKFAKVQTMLNENDMNLLRALNFVNATKLETPETETSKPIVTPEVKRSTRKRLSLKIVNIVLYVAAIAVLVYVIYDLFNIL